MSRNDLREEEMSGLTGPEIGASCFALAITILSMYLKRRALRPGGCIQKMIKNKTTDLRLKRSIRILAIHDDPLLYRGLEENLKRANGGSAEMAKAEIASQRARSEQILSKNGNGDLVSEEEYIILLANMCFGVSVNLGLLYLFGLFLIFHWYSNGPLEHRRIYYMHLLFYMKLFSGFILTTMIDNFLLVWRYDLGRYPTCRDFARVMKEIYIIIGSPCCESHSDLTGDIEEPLLVVTGCE
eukprot:CAMPEP_0198292784 /NCGR_PEP_ID=MMETSP1449-20131203/13920_1 /TAXON_ID=420275 /ORGANISM="Attheya septentrionalis, Strain CCMP2084" /LENGTH=240 /DNA_ID=CAMNT_0043992087 /DNA_START=131 /DNA_END=853 /DNA_ORIENTATION=-